VILVDTCVWVDHFAGRPGAASLRLLLDEGDVATHPWVVGELALGTLGPRRSSILADLGRLPMVPAVPDGDILRLVSLRRLHGSAIGWVDAHLLGSCLVADARLWTRDRALARCAARLGVAWSPATSG
jgi:predicted nucleic acid-binding protein